MIGKTRSTPSTTLQVPTRINPGNVFTATDSISYQSGQLAAQIIGSLSLQTPTIENGVPLYRGGARYLVAGTWSYSWPEAGVTTLTASAAHTNRNDVLFLGAPALVKEAMNTNSNLYRVGLQHLIPVGRVTFGPPPAFCIGTTTNTTPRRCNSYPRRIVGPQEHWCELA